MATAIGVDGLNTAEAADRVDRSTDVDDGDDVDTKSGLEGVPADDPNEEENDTLDEVADDVSAAADQLAVAEDVAGAPNTDEVEKKSGRKLMAVPFSIGGAGHMILPESPSLG